MIYRVIVHETVERTYYVDADSPQEAKEVWEETSGDELDSETECLNCELVHVMTDSGEMCEVE